MKHTNVYQKKVTSGFMFYYPLNAVFLCSSTNPPDVYNLMDLHLWQFYFLLNPRIKNENTLLYVWITRIVSPLRSQITPQSTTPQASDSFSLFRFVSIIIFFQTNTPLVRIKWLKLLCCIGYIQGLAWPITWDIWEDPLVPPREVY